MAITSDQIKFYRSIYVNDSLTNGGRIGPAVMVDNSLNNLFRNVQSAEREAGIDLYRKFFVKNENPNDLGLLNPKIYIANVSSGEDYFLLAAGTDQDNQASAVGFTDWYGSGYLDENIGNADTSFDIQFKQAIGLPDDCLLKISDGVQSAEYQMIGEVSWNANIATVNISGEVGLTFLKDTTVVSVVLPLGDLAPLISDWAEDSALGTYDEVGHPVTLYNIGVITESWTLTFTNATTFSVTGAVVGSVGLGSINAIFAPVNPEGGFYFNLNNGGWAGSFGSGDNITFNTIHAAKGVWVKESVPAGAESQANNLMMVKLQGESA